MTFKDVGKERVGLSGRGVIEKLEELGVTPEDLATDDAYYACIGAGDGDVRREHAVAALGPFLRVDQNGGEGQGDEWYSVTHFRDHDVYIKVEAWYSSYAGVNFDGSEFREVRPAAKTITVYE